MKPEFDPTAEQEIYLDNAATTIMADEVVDSMRPYLEERYGNPETAYRLGREAKESVEKARASVAELLGCQPEEVFFTSGGTESNNWAIKGIDFDHEKYGMLASKVEHASVLEPARWLSRTQRMAYEEIPVDAIGSIDLGFLTDKLSRRDVRLVSVQYGNNEIGTIQPVKEVRDLCQKYGAIFHCDAVQAFGKVDFKVDDLGADDLVSVSSHKIHGPMGMGALYIKKGTNIEPLMHGGGHENGMRSGTLAVQNIVGFGTACELAIESVQRDMKRISGLVDFMAADLALKVGAKRNGHPTNRLPHILSITIPKMDANLVCGIMCSHHGICVSAGAACSTSKHTSHVLSAIGLNKTEMNSTLRISLSRYTTDSQIKIFIAALQRSISEAKGRDLL